MVKVTKKENKAWVTFTFPRSEDVRSVHVAGEWSEWEHEPMKQKKNGEYSITKILNAGERFEFGYKINGEHWHKDGDLPSVTSPFGTENSLLLL
jgi:hypothetical protein